jgi:hypothetical protein
MAPATDNGDSPRGVPLWAKGLIGLAVVAIVAAGISVYYTFNPTQADPQVQPSTPAPSPSRPAPSQPAEAGSGVGVVTGCFVGPQDNTQALLAAQEKAPHTTSGAVELAGQFMKWARQYPLPTLEGAKTVDERVVSDAANDSVPRFAEKAKNDRPQNAKPYATSFEQGYYLVLEQSADRVVVSIYGGALPEGTDTPMASVYGTLTMAWDRWSGWLGFRRC